jgi:hypothetical protein
MLTAASAEVERTPLQCVDDQHGPSRCNPSRDGAGGDSYASAGGRITPWRAGGCSGLGTVGTKRRRGNPALITYPCFMIIATMIAGIGAMLDQPILIVGAMVVGPEFGRSLHSVSAS